MEGKKISFGFMKTKKTEKPVVKENKEYIECVEEKSIRIVGGETVKEETPLVIPMKPNTLITTERLQQIAEEVENAVNIQPEPDKETKLDTDTKTGENETLDQMAVRELMQDAKKETKTVVQALTVPIPAQPVLDGHKESTMEDYESVPIQQFGLAMLRGMGWTPGNEKVKYKDPQLRPKGLGLGADKVIKDNQKKNVSKDKEEELTIIKNAFVKITSGKYSGCYGKVISLDEDNGRVMVDISVKKETVSLSEFMMQPVTKNEFDKHSRVINADAYEEYKKRSEQMSSKSSKLNNKESQKVSERESSSNRKTYEENRHERNVNSKSDDASNGKNREKYRANSSSSDERSRRVKKKEKRRDPSSSDERANRVKEKPRKKYTSDESSSDSESHKRRHKKNRRRSTSPDLKRDIDKKRKGKKKKRDRDRSPNYKKYRK